GPVRAVSDVELAAARGRTLAIVGESGCGKSTVAKVLSGLEVATSGSVVLDGVEVGALAVDARSAALKRKLQMVFQNPDSTLNPGPPGGRGDGAGAGAAPARCPGRSGRRRGPAPGRGEALARPGGAQAAPPVRRREAARGDRAGPGERPRRGRGRRAG